MAPWNSALLRSHAGLRSAERSRYVSHDRSHLAPLDPPCIRPFGPPSPARGRGAAAPSIFLPQPTVMGGPMDARLALELAKAQEAFTPVEHVEGALDAAVLVVCDHASNAFPPGYGALGLPRETLERHIAYDIGAAWMTRRLATRLNAPAVLSTFSRLLIDPHRGADDPTLVMRISDGAIVAGNARIDAAEIERRRRLFWAPYRDAVATMVEQML